MERLENPTINKHKIKNPDSKWEKPGNVAWIRAKADASGAWKSPAELSKIPEFLIEWFCSVFMLFRSCTVVLGLARPCTLRNYWWWSTIPHDVIRSLTRFEIARPFFGWNGRSVPGCCCTPSRTDRSSPRLCWFIGYARSFFIWNDRSSPSRLVFLERPVAPLVHCRVDQLCRRCTTVHQVERSFHRPSSESLTECPQLCRFVRKVLVFAIILSGMLF